MALFASQPFSPTRASSGFNFLSKIKSHKESKLGVQRPQQQRSSSDGSAPTQPSRCSHISIPAQQGAGLKTRRLSASPQDDFVVDTCELDDEFASASKIGRRKEIGQGASATVKIMQRKGQKKSDRDCLLAVKEFRKRSIREDEEDYVRKVKSEYTIAKSLNHPNIVRTVRLCTHAGRWNHVMEYCQQRELFSLVERKYLKSEDKYCILKQVLRAVDYLHDHGIAHRDIKLENLLMTDEGYIKVTDFGVSEVFCGDHPGLPSSQGQCGKGMEENRKSVPGICGSRPYISPEVLAKDKEYDSTKLDVWSCGILFLTLYHNGNPWQSASKSEVNYALFAEGWDALLSRSADTAIDENAYPQCGPLFSTLPIQSQRRCVLKMLHPDPNKRCTIKEALNDRWVKKIDCCSPDAVASISTIDVSKVGCHMIAARMNIQAKHDHLPPPIKRMPQHRFDMGDGTSRYG